ncbi:uncharacterized protein LOC128397060 [Panonychus citri]|uniref:uncharacterized protein LOC128396784 n=1 Tax=Panonychus citri TaxID=50023 RepID=UPI0023077DBF|nr:uncharacterized protein LOC128396784 [Panonychus citri]XP_053213702.1 uncharacterized protein LOC128397060 [Panonychus citri]
MVANSLEASSLDVQQSPIIVSPVAQTASVVQTPIVNSPVGSTPVLVEPQFQELPLDVQLPSVVDTEEVSIANSPTYLKEFSMTDHLFPSFKKISSSFSTGTSKFKSILPGNPFKKWSGKSEDVEIVEEIPVVAVKERVDPIPYKFNSEIPKKLIAKAAAVGQAKLTQLAAANKGKLNGPGLLEASVKVQHPIVGKQSAKIKLSTV